MPNYSRGQIVKARLPPGLDHEQQGVRPVIILRYVPAHNLAIIVPLTSQTRAEAYHHTVYIEPSKQNGLSETSIALGYQVRSLSINRFDERLGHLSDDDLQTVTRTLVELVAGENAIPKLADSKSAAGNARNNSLSSS